MRKDSLIAKVAEITGKTKRDTKIFVEALISGIISGVIEDGEVNLNEFGQFYKSVRKASVTQCQFSHDTAKYEVKEVTSIKFRTSKTLKKYLSS